MTISKKLEGEEKNYGKENSRFSVAVRLLLRRMVCIMHLKFLLFRLGFVCFVLDASLWKLESNEFWDFYSSFDKNPNPFIFTKIFFETSMQGPFSRRPGSPNKESSFCTDKMDSDHDGMVLETTTQQTWFHHFSAFFPSQLYPTAII